MTLNRQRGESYPLRRRDVVAALLAERGDLLVVSGLGAPSWDVTAAGDHPANFPLWGAMGGGAMVGLGLALAQPARRVLVVTGDGEMLMGLGSLATVGVARPGNLAIVVLDNERYGETGMQATHTAGAADLAAAARALGLPVTATASDAAGLAEVLPLARDAGGPVLVVVKVRAETLPLVLPPKDGALLKDRFRAALLGGEGD
ncbi:MAG: thiamine pyrophosphate-dependent enzyme [Rhodospirillales bacterium]|nr:thiamine pyrophosphate-dependent enzyme [Rhodospirillales bacterium]